MKCQYIYSENNDTIENTLLSKNALSKHQMSNTHINYILYIDNSIQD